MILNGKVGIAGLFLDAIFVCYNFLMFEKVIAWDKKLFLRINKLPHPKFLVKGFIFIDLLSYWGLALIIVSFFLIIFGNFEQKYFGINGIFVVLITTLTNEVFLKGLFLKRKRPHQQLESIRLYWLKPRTFSFPSGQTTSAFSWTVFFSLVYQSWLILVIGLVFGILTGTERVYLGAHYVSDIIGGIVIGSLIGWLWYVILIK